MMLTGLRSVQRESGEFGRSGLEEFDAGARGGLQQMALHGGTGALRVTGGNGGGDGAMFFGGFPDARVIRKRQTLAVADARFEIAHHLQQPAVAGQFRDQLVEFKIGLRGADQVDVFQRIFKARLHAHKRGVVWALMTRAASAAAASSKT